MKIAVVKYNAGNIRSLSYALERIGVEAVVTDDERVLRSADKVIFPGVGEASSAMSYLRERKLDEVLRSLTQPFLGICLGLQLMCAHSEEGDVDCLGIFPQNVKAFPPEMKVPQIGWNNLKELRSPLFKGLDETSYVYFVHGYYAELGEGTIARANYILDYSAALHRDNFYATQFHPEKSGRVGDRILRNFIEL
ncbi:MAG: imidazole glycerol phosphate synthase subunit HisH [Paludibacteraceae bacterium]|nr:imidazole glycerol phosphate synthase subunit HisH [Paludibacteraceae bacterium]